MAKKIVLFILGYFAWIGVIGFVGMNTLDTLFADKTSPFTATTGPIVFIIAALIVFGGPIVIFMFWFYHTPKWEKDIQTTGTLAQALVVDVKNTGVYTGSRYNGTPWWRVTLQVKPTSDSSFEVVLEKSADQFFMVHQGSTINVKYDPNNKKHVVLVKPETQFGNNTGFASPSVKTPTVINMQNGNIPPEFAQLINNALHQVGQQGNVVGNKQTSGGNVAQQLIELATLHKQGELTDTEFEAAKKKLFS